MIDFQGLNDLRLGKLKEAVPQWETMAKKLKELADGGGEVDSAADLEKKARAADWKGANASVTKDFVTKTAREFDDIVTAAQSVHDVLQNAHASFVRHKTDLDAAVTRGKNKGLHVSATGFVSPREEADPEPTQEDIDATIQDIERVLREANATDRIVKEALKALSKNKYDFVSKGTSLEAVRKLDERQAIADAKTAEKIALQEGPISDTQLVKLDSVFARQADNAIFATRFYKALGPEESLRFNVEVATQFSMDRDPQSLKRAERIQDNMGRALAAATRDVGAKGYLSHEWVEGLKRHGHNQFYVEIGGDMGVSAYGYQSLGSLLGSGNYSTEFLNSVSQEMVDLDKTLAGEWPSGEPFADWTLDLTDAVEDQPEQGIDPISGLMQAHSHNPQAAEELFSDEDNIEYLLTEDFPSKERNDAIGNALETSVYGYDFDVVPATAPEHSTEQALIMKNVMEIVSRNPELVSGHLSDNLGGMTGAYMPEINRALAGEGDATKALFPAGNDVDFTEHTTERFLYELARDPETYAAVVISQNGYSASMMEHYVVDPPEDHTRASAVTQIAQNAGIIQGVMAHSLADVEIGAAVAEEQEYDQEMIRQGNSFKSFATVGVAAAVASVPPGPYTIPAAAGGAFVGSAASMIIDEITAARTDSEGKGVDAAFLGAGTNYEERKDDAFKVLDRQVWAAVKENDIPLTEGELEKYIRTGVNNGFTWADSSLGVYQNRPDREVG